MPTMRKVRWSTQRQHYTTEDENTALPSTSGGNMATQVPGYGEDAIPAPTPAPTTASDDKPPGEAVANSQDTAASTRNDPPFASHTWSDTMGPMPRMPSLTRSDSMREHHAVRRLVKQFEVDAGYRGSTTANCYNITPFRGTLGEIEEQQRWRRQETKTRPRRSHGIPQ